MYINLGPGKSNFKNKVKIRLFVLLVFLASLFDGFRTWLEDVGRGGQGEIRLWHGELPFENAVRLHREGKLRLELNHDLYGSLYKDMSKEFESILAPPNIWTYLFMLCLPAAVILSIFWRWRAFIPALAAAFICLNLSRRAFCRDGFHKALPHESFYKRLLETEGLLIYVTDEYSLEKLAWLEGLGPGINGPLEPPVSGCSEEEVSDKEK